MPRFHPRLVLASASPRRRELLAAASLDFLVDPGNGVEPAPLPGESPQDYALRVARAKALAVAPRRPGAVVLAADTVVAFGKEIMGKPADAGEAEAMISLLCGFSGDPAQDDLGVRSHVVVTAFVLVDCRGAAQGDDAGALRRIERAVSTTVAMALQRAETIRDYAASGEPLDKAGGYAIQGRGGFLVKEIFGSYSNVVGLPLAEVMEALQDL